jgi:hypothetical protein
MENQTELLIRIAIERESIHDTCKVGLFVIFFCVLHALSVCHEAPSRCEQSITDVVMAIFLYSGIMTVWYICHKVKVYQHTRP